MIRIAVDPFPSDEALRQLWEKAWGDAGPASWQGVLKRSLAHIGAFEGEKLVGFVNVAWDGGVHAFILDTCVDRDFRRQGIATRLVKAAEEAARERGAKWLHVDFEPHLMEFYRGCGFRPTEAGLIAL
jgi:GNAT superfamily N-acetyltransferase